MWAEWRFTGKRFCGFLNFLFFFRDPIYNASEQEVFSTQFIFMQKDGRDHTDLLLSSWSTAGQWFRQHLFLNLLLPSLTAHLNEPGKLPQCSLKKDKIYGLFPLEMGKKQIIFLHYTLIKPFQNLVPRQLLLLPSQIPGQHQVQIPSHLVQGWKLQVVLRTQDKPQWAFEISVLWHGTWKISLQQSAVGHRTSGVCRSPWLLKRMLTSLFTAQKSLELYGPALKIEIFSFEDLIFDGYCKSV